MTSGTTANRGANSPAWYLAPLHPAMLARCLPQRGIRRGGRRGCNVLVPCEMPATVEGRRGGVLRRPGRLDRWGEVQGRGVSDPRFDLARSANARPRGSLTPRCLGQLVRHYPAHFAVRSRLVAVSVDAAPMQRRVAFGGPVLETRLFGGNGTWR